MFEIQCKSCEQTLSGPLSNVLPTAREAKPFFLFCFIRQIDFAPNSNQLNFLFEL